MTSGDTGKITDERWERVQELFSRAIELPEGERDAFIQKEAGSDAELRKELVELLACDTGSSTGPLTQALGAALDATTRDRRKALLGRKVGNYKLVSVLGHGGTGTVYLGERADRQYSAQVAIKIVDSATVQGELGLRFRAERQILASLNHTNIARLLDAGETEEGQPYLVMEYVHGEPLDRYCDRHQLDLRGRLQLFLDICSAVQYAHQNLVVHRDLKPANILVTSEGAPKLLDFGIAKLLDTSEAAAALALTRMNDRLLTPEYASPEQILGRPVTTASDVYTLGVVLYELLTGLRPYTVPASASQLELERSICISDPQRPSAAVHRALENGPLQGQSEMLAIASARGVTGEKLQRRLVGDIDAIVMRTLRKEPQHRYSSVEQFAADVRRHLGREPVHARQGTWLYYSQRFVRRHAFGVSASATFAAIVIAFAIAMSIQTQRVAAERDRAAQEGERAEKVSEFMLRIFDATQPQTSLGRSITAQEVLDEAGRRIRGDLNQHPEVRARLLEAIGRAYRQQNLNERAIPYLEDALRIREQTPDSDGTKIAAVKTDLAIALRAMGDLNRSNQLLNEALALSRERRNERSATYARLLTNLGRVQLTAGNSVESRQNLEASLALMRTLLAPDDPEIASVLMELARVFTWNDELQAAEKAVREAISIFSVKFPEEHPDRVLAEARLGEVLLLQNRINEAYPLFERSLELQIQLYGNNSRQVADVLDSLANIRRAQGELDKAEDFARRALAANEAAMGAEHRDTGYFCTSLALILTQRGKHAEAERLARRALATYEKTLPPDHQYVAAAEHVLGEVLIETNKLNDAEAMLTAAMNRWKRTDAAQWRVARSESALGEVLYRQGRMREAERHLTESFRILALNDNADRDARAKAQRRVTRFYTDRGEQQKLRELMLATNQEPDSLRGNSN